ncbi:MAG: hypothetical protein JNK64_17500 [Myxococcales bacterium]|nr:hypothetical protein [Myxococcales bacterium]
MAGPTTPTRRRDGAGGLRGAPAAVRQLAVGASLIWPTTTRLDFNLGVLAAALATLTRWWRQGRAPAP